MKRLLQFLSTATVMAVILTPLAAGTAFADSASLTFAPSASTITNGNTVTVYVHENSGATQVNAAQANFQYPANLLQFVSVASSSAFDVAGPNPGGGGTVSIARGAFSPLTGDQVVASVQFKAIATGTATFTFVTGTNQSAVVTYSGSTNILTSSPSASITINAPVTPPPPSPKPGPKPGPTPTPTKDTTPPTITAVSVKDVTSSGATVTWTTSEAATSEVDYGLSGTYGLSKVDGTLGTSHSLVLSSGIVSGTTFHFVVKSADAAGNVATSPDNTFVTKGVSLQVTVLDEKTNKPIAGVTVSYNGQNVTTDSNGQATLTNLPSTKIVVTVTVAGKSTSQTVQVANDTGTLQNTSFKVAAPPSSMPWALVAVPVVLIVAGAAIFALFRSRMNNSLGNGGGAGGSPVVITSDNYSSMAPGSSVVSPTNPPDNTNNPLMQ